MVDPIISRVKAGRAAERKKELYKLNGMLWSVLKKLGPCIGTERMLLSVEDMRYRELSDIYDMLKAHTDKLYEDYVR